MNALNYSGKSRFEIIAGPIHLAAIPDISLTGAMKGNWQFTLEVLEINFHKDGFFWDSNDTFLPSIRFQDL